MQNIISSYNNTQTTIYIKQHGEIISDNMRYANTFFEINFLNFIKENFLNQNEILDIGANIGNHSLFFLKFLNCKKVHSFEPVKSNLSFLKKNVDQYLDKSMIYDIALSDKEGYATLYNSQMSNDGGFSLHSYSNGASFIVEDNILVKKLDSYNLNNISMIKIDVENHENEVLDGARDTINRNKPIIFIENLFHGYPNVCPDPEPHKTIFEELNYKKTFSNILGSYMDLWVPI
jgi:FkbM family methyltransferase